MSEFLRLQPRTKAKWSVFSPCIYLEHVYVHYPFYLFKYLSYTYCIILLNHLTISAVCFFFFDTVYFAISAFKKKLCVCVRTCTRVCVCVVCIWTQVYVLVCALARGQCLVSFFPP